MSQASIFDLRSIETLIDSTLPSAPLVFDGSGIELITPSTVYPERIIIDSCVYSDNLWDRIPADADQLIFGGRVTHCFSSVVAAEISCKLSLFDPNHADTPKNKPYWDGMVMHMAANPNYHRCSVVDASAAYLAGKVMLSWDLSCPKRRKRKPPVNDAGIYLHAKAAGAALVTSNTIDFDMISRTFPGVRVLYYDAY